MTRTITAAVLLSLTPSVLPAAATADDATAIITAVAVDLPANHRRNVRTLRQAGWSWSCIAQDIPTTTKGPVITVGLMHVGGLVIGVCTPAPSVHPTHGPESSPRTNGSLDSMEGRQEGGTATKRG